MLARLAHSPLASSNCHRSCRIDGSTGYTAVTQLGPQLRKICPGVPLNRHTPRRLRHELNHAKSVGVVASNCEGKSYVKWLKWWDVPFDLQFVFRFLSRGEKWYMLNRDLDPKRDFYPDTISFNGLRSWRERVKEDGLLIRKEDRGKRMVIFESNLEKDWFQSEVARRSLTEIDVQAKSETYTFSQKSWAPGQRKENVVKGSPRPAAKVYFLPKAHKPVLSGRLIENCRGLKTRKLDESVTKSLSPWNFRDVSKAVVKMVPNTGSSGLAYFSGDVEKLFPSIPQNELLSMLLTELGTKVHDQVFQLLQNYTLSFQGIRYKVGLGLPIGHPWSPALAEFYLCQKERSFAKNTDYKFVRYADDTIFAISPRLMRTAMQKYQEAVAPLKVEWEIPPPDERIKFLDANFKALVPPDNLAASKKNLFYPEYNDKGYGPPNGELPSEMIVQSIVGKILRIAQIESSLATKLPNGKWSVGLLLVQYRRESAARDAFFMSINDAGLWHLMKDVEKCFTRNARSIPKLEKPIVRHCWHPRWRSKAGALLLKELRKTHQVRWDMRYVRTIGRLARV